MNRISIRSVLFAWVLLMTAVASARANTITPVLGIFTPGVSMTYQVNVSNGTLVSGDGFTIFDFGGFQGSATMPNNWSLGFDPGPVYAYQAPVGPDNPQLPNLRFFYTGPTTLVIFSPLLFTVSTSSLLTSFDDWTSRDHSPSNPSVKSQPNAGEINVPVPDGGSTAALLGSVLVAFGVLRRKFSRS
jgi:VPDSG-CTERM motif